MKFLLMLVLLLNTFPVHANESHCYSIKNSDAKNSCLALAKNQDSYCYSIREADSKNLCLAQVKNQKSYCYSIKSSDSKNQCLAFVKQQKWCSPCHPLKGQLRGLAMNFEPFYILIALIMLFVFYRRNIGSLMQDKKETLQIFIIIMLVACFLFLISDYLLGIRSNNIR